MKGVVFTEFLELVEGQWGLAMADQLLVKGCPFHGGYTSVGTYDHRDLLAMIEELSRATARSKADLVRVFGKHLFERFWQLYPEAFAGVDSTFALLERVEKSIHVEVFKLSPDAELPSFQFHEAPAGHLIITYSSKRPFADLAEGLIAGCIEHFGESLELERQDMRLDGTQARFFLKPRGLSAPPLGSVVAIQSFEAREMNQTNCDV